MSLHVPKSQHMLEKVRNCRDVIVHGVGFSNLQEICLYIVIVVSAVCYICFGYCLIGVQGCHDNTLTAFFCFN